MKRIIAIGAIASGLFLNYSCEQKSKEQQGETVDAAEERNDTTLTSETKKDDSEFLVKAANSGLLEVQAATIAKERGVSKDVKKFAQHLIDDHSKANTELKAYASKKNIALPDSVDKDYQDQLEKLREKKGKEFDDEFIDFAVDAHKKDVNMFEDASKDANDTELKAWVDKTLPTLRHHLEIAQQTDSLLEAREDNKSGKNKL